MYEALGNWEVWRALKKLELLSTMPQATLRYLSCSPNFLHASYLDEHMLTHEPKILLRVKFCKNTDGTSNKEGLRAC